MTPKMLSNMAQSLEDGGMEAKDIDGFEELPDDVQEKVIRAVEQGHVDDEDWNGVGPLQCGLCFCW